jgi:hypothetical protein
VTKQEKYELCDERAELSETCQSFKKYTHHAQKAMIVLVEIGDGLPKNVMSFELFQLKERSLLLLQTMQTGQRYQT